MLSFLGQEEAVLLLLALQKARDGVRALLLLALKGLGRWWILPNSNFNHFSAK